MTSRRASNRSHHIAGLVYFVALTAFLIADADAVLVTIAIGAAGAATTGARIDPRWTSRLGWLAVAAMVAMALHLALMERPLLAILTGAVAVVTVALDSRGGRGMPVEPDEALRTVYDASPEPTVLHMGGTVIYANRAATEVVGEDLDGRRVVDFVHPDDRQRVRRGMDTVTGERLVPLDEIRLIDGNGREIPVQVSNVTMTYGGDLVVRSILRDLSQSVSLRDATPRAARELGALFDRLPVALYRSTRDGQVIAANQALAAMFGLESVDQMLADPEWAFSAYPDAERRRQWLETIEQDGVLVDFEQHMTRADGEPLVASDSARAITDGSGNLLYFEGALVDVTRGRRAQSDRDRYAEIIERASDLIAIADLDGRCRAGNVAFRNFVGIPEGPLDHIEMASLLADDDESIVEEIRNSLDRHGAWNGTARLRGASTAVAVVESTIVVHTDSFDGRRFVAFIGRDVSEAARTAEELARVIRSKDAVVASVSHELRNPLSAAAGLATELDSATDLDEASRSELIALVARATREASDIVDDLLLASRIDVSPESIVVESVAVDLSPLVVSVVEAMDVASKEVTIETEPVTASGDPIRIRQIVRNLVSNAVRHGGESISVSVRSTDDTAVVAVSDDGAGIRVGSEEAVFEPFGRPVTAETSSASVGVGLSLSRFLARRMGGELDYRDGETVTFMLTLPLESR